MVAAREPVARRLALALALAEVATVGQEKPGHSGGPTRIFLLLSLVLSWVPSDLLDS